MGTDKDGANTLAVQATPLTWRIAIAAGIVALGLTAFFLQDLVSQRGQAAVGVACFIGLLAACSANLRAVNWRTVLWGFGLQVLLALFVIRFRVPGFAEWCQSLGLKQVTEDRPGYVLFQAIASVFQELLAFSNEGCAFRIRRSG